MSYQVLARKWRPRRFAEMVGQEHVVRALGNALSSDRLHHAYLFAGTRGVGKTTLARIFAKALNCESGVTAEPCGECPACLEIDQGRFVDLIEVDAASRSKVDETRDLLDNVPYAPARGRYKVYLIDEVHMFSRNSFNALLKTLEEPPPHVKFLLATTDPAKLPVTVLSRCLQFQLRALSETQIERQLRMLLEAEAVSAEDAAVRVLARAARGSMRDALSLLDQAIAFGAGSVREADTRDMLGVSSGTAVWELLERLAAADGPGLLASLAALEETAPDHDGLLAELLDALQVLAVAQVVPQAGLPAEVQSEVGEERVMALAAALPAEDVQLFYQIGVMGRRDMAYALSPRSGLQMTLLRMLAFHPEPPPRPDGAGRPADPAGHRGPGGPEGQGGSRGAGPRGPGGPRGLDGPGDAAGAPGGGTTPGARAAAPRPPLRAPSRPAPRAAPDPMTGERAGEGAAALTTPPPRVAAPVAAPMSRLEPATLPSPAPPPAAGAALSPPPAPATPAAAGAAALATPLAAGAALSPSPAPATSPAAGPAPPVATLDAAPAAPAAPAAQGATLTPAQWAAVVDGLQLGGLARELASNTELVSHEAGRIVLRLAPTHAQLRGARAETALREALAAHLGGAVALQLQVGERSGESPAERARRAAEQRLQAAASSMSSDPAVISICELFGASVEPGSVKITPQGTG